MNFQFQPLHFMNRKHVRQFYYFREERNNMHVIIVLKNFQQNKLTEDIRINHIKILLLRSQKGNYKMFRKSCIRSNEIEKKKKKKFEIYLLLNRNGYYLLALQKFFLYFIICYKMVCYSKYNY